MEAADWRRPLNDSIAELKIMSKERYNGFPIIMQLSHENLILWTSGTYTIKKSEYVLQDVEDGNQLVSHQSQRGITSDSPIPAYFYPFKTPTPSKNNQFLFLLLGAECRFCSGDISFTY